MFSVWAKATWGQFVAILGQFAIVSGQFSAILGQFAAILGQLAAIFRQLTACFLLSLLLPALLLVSRGGASSGKGSDPADFLECYTLQWFNCEEQ